MSVDHAEVARVIAAEIGELREDLRAADIGPASALWSRRTDDMALGLTSLDFLELLYRIEQRTSVRLPATIEPIGIDTVGDLVATVVRAQEGTGPGAG